MRIASEMLLFLKALIYCEKVDIIQKRTAKASCIALKNPEALPERPGIKPGYILQTADMQAAHPLHISVGLPCGNTRGANYFVQT